MQTNYVVCAQCDEFRQAALLRNHLPVLCRNCSDLNHARGLCLVCFRIDVPLERHHVRGRRYGHATVPLCCSCHADITARQYEWPALIAQVDTPGLSNRFKYTTMGALELLLMSWSQARLRADRTERSFLALLVTGAVIAGAFLQEAAR